MVEDIIYCALAKWEIMKQVYKIGRAHNWAPDLILLFEIFLKKEYAG